MKLWVDDIREPPDGSWTWCKTSDHALKILQSLKHLGHTSIMDIETMSLDHDLGGDDTTRPIVRWLCYEGQWPVEVLTHTANPVGREWLEGMIARYKV